tara:strand:+ start:911 stop:1285 length:375 start_codon:yes stop_codon:yes gene_type:complete
MEKKMIESYTEDLSKFGYREKAIANDLIQALNNKKTPDDFDLSGVKVAFNMMSGYVFLTNDEYQVCMIDDENNLYSFYTLMYEGLEGDFDELLEQYEDMHPEDQEQFRDIAKNIGREEEIKCNI